MEPEPEREPEAVSPPGVVVEILAGGHGSSLRASRAFAAGEIMLEEPPRFVLLDAAEANPELLAAVCEASGMPPDADMARKIAGVLELWLGADEPARVALREMFGTPDDPELGMAEFIDTLVVDVQKLYAPLGGSVPADMAHVVLVWLLSAHTIDAGSAVFETGHRCNHSCAPNVTYSNSGASDPSALVFRALRPIAKGEPLQVSYLTSHDLLAPGIVRRQILAKRKSFECACGRCVADLSLPPGDEPGRTLPLRSGSSGEPSAADKAAALQQEEQLVAQALSGELALSSMDRADWGGHWVFAAALWSDGLSRLRGGVEGGDGVLARSSFPILGEYFSWVRSRHPTRCHFVSSQAAECYACLVALQDEDANVLASETCTPFMHALENEYGELDAQNVQMRAWLKSHCGRCGKAAESCCTRCKIVGYCSSECQKAASEAHGPICKAATERGCEQELQ